MIEQTFSCAQFYCKEFPLVNKIIRHLYGYTLNCVGHKMSKVFFLYEGQMCRPKVSYLYVGQVEVKTSASL